MTRARTSVATVAVVLAAALPVAGCGDDDDSSSSTSTTMPVVTTTTIAGPAQPDETDQAAAEAVVLQLPDLGGGWTAQPWPEGDQPFFANVSGDCEFMREVEAVDALTARAHSEQFGAAGKTEIAANKVQVYADAAAAAAAMDAFRSGTAAECIGASIAGFVAVSDDIDPEGLAFEKIELTTPGAVGYAGVLKADTGPTPLSIGMVFGAAQVGRTLVVSVAYRLDGGRAELDPKLAPVVSRVAAQPELS